jgi:hypothetical protein
MNVKKVSHKWWLSIGATIMLAALVWVVGTAVAQGPDGNPPVAPAGGPSLTDTFTYQGRLEDDGQPANDNYDFIVEIWDGDDPWGSYVAPCDNHASLNNLNNFPVEDGVFTFHLICDWNSDVFTGDPRWIQVYVREAGSGGAYTKLPRQPITAVPYAWSLRPGAVISGTAWGWDFGDALVNIHNDATWYPALLVHSSTASAVNAQSPGGMAVVGSTDDGYAVTGWDYGVEEGRGYGGFFSSNNGVGLYGRSFAQSHYTNMYAPGVYGDSYYGTGVYGKTECTGWPCYGGVFQGGTGISAKGTGTSNYGGIFYSEDYRGIYARSTTNASYYAGYFKGRGSTYPGVYIDGTLIVSGAKSGYVADVCLNDGPEPLEVGDVVAVVGADDPVIGEIPVMRVRKATAETASAVVGVVDQRFLVHSPEGESLLHPDASVPRLASGTAIEQDEYVSVVTLGAFKAIKVDASYGAIQPGDLLIASPNPGYAMRAADPKPGTIIGKALEALDAGTGTIKVMVTLH